MNKSTYLLFGALPAIIAPAMAQQSDVSISASDFVQTQIAIIKSMTELLTMQGIAEAPQEVAAGINQLAGMVQQLTTLKPVATEADKEMIETELADQARTAALELQKALEATVANNFYNSQELADAVQNFARSFKSLK